MIVPGIAALDSLTRPEGSAFGGVAGQAPAIGQSSFAEALGDVANRTIGTLQSAEQLSLKALQGEAQTREVVDAVMSAEQTLQTAIAIRDKIVTAYLEVSRMQI